MAPLHGKQCVLSYTEKGGRGKPGTNHKTDCRQGGVYGAAGPAFWRKKKKEQMAFEKVQKKILIFRLMQKKKCGLVDRVGKKDQQSESPK